MQSDSNITTEDIEAYLWYKLSEWYIYIICLLVVLLLLQHDRYNNERNDNHTSRRRRSKSKQRNTSRMSAKNRVTADLVDLLRQPQQQYQTGSTIADLMEAGEVSFITEELADIIMGDKICLSVLAEVMATQSRASTLKTYSSKWRAWVAFAKERNYDILPPASTVDGRKLFELHFDCFAMHEYNRCRTRRYKTTKGIKPMTPKAFRSIFTGINFMLTKVYNLPVVQTNLMAKLNNAYANNYPSKTKKAKPMLGCHLRKLIETMERLGPENEWFTLVTCVVIVAWMSAGRWSCVAALNVEKSVKDFVCKELGSSVTPEVWLMYMKQRKNVKGESVTEVPRMTGDMEKYDAFNRFEYIVNKYKRTRTPVGVEKWNWIPCVKKTMNRNEWTIDPDTSKYCSYNQFLPMFRAAMTLADIQNDFEYNGTDEWTLHAMRVGWITSARERGLKLRLKFETIARHGQFSEKSVAVMMGYSQATTLEHVRLMKPSIEAMLRA